MKKYLGKVVCWFKCEKTYTFNYDDDITFSTPAYDGAPSCYRCGPGSWITYEELQATCLSEKELERYGNGKTLYGFGISNLQVLRKPMELSEIVVNSYRPLTRPPQSYMYIAECIKQLPLIQYLLYILKLPTYSQLISEETFEKMAYALVENGAVIYEKPRQIEEIKDCIDSVYGCDCAYYGVDGIAIATVLAEQGYRKASEVAREIFAETIKTVGKIITSNIEGDNSLIETEVDIFHALVELKKKYEVTEDEQTS